MFNFDNLTEKDENNDWSYRKFIIGLSGSGKTIYLLEYKNTIILLIKLIYMPKI